MQHVLSDRRALLWRVARKLPLPVLHTLPVAPGDPS